jgi:cytochrome c oxidase cbb3-type subunit 2
MHLYNPQLTSPGSNMPSYKFLFEKRKIAGQEDAEALKLTGALAPPPGYEIVPTTEAHQLVAYLTTLDHSHPLPEAGPNIQPPKPSVPGGSTK